MSDRRLINLSAAASAVVFSFTIAAPFAVSGGLDGEMAMERLVLAQADVDEKSDRDALRKRRRQLVEDDDNDDDDDEGRRKVRCPPGEKRAPRRGRGGDHGGCVAR